MFYQLPPVGNPVCLSRADDQQALLQAFGTTYQAYYYASGTAALAAAIAAAIQLKAVDEPEVLLPAYACPDLISAAVFAGAKPVLVDLEEDRPWMDLEQVSAKISARTVAIIAVDLLGISERLLELRTLAEQAGAVLIEDSAQAFPGGKENNIWQGDLVVLSFGRGKPVSLLGGGAVLARDDAIAGLLPKFKAQADDGLQRRLLFGLKVALYNRMISPGLYWLPQSLPFLNLGETHYYPLSSIKEMDATRLSILPSNVKFYQNDPMDTQKNLAEMLDELDFEGPGIIDLPGACKVSVDRRLLRYPLLVKSGRREPLFTRLRRFGASCMYPAVLTGISGLEPLLAEQGTFPAAVSFSNRLLTLPTHSQVSRADIGKMFELLSN